jgi:hypothetical protein
MQKYDFSTVSLAMLVRVVRLKYCHTNEIGAARFFM